MKNFEEENYYECSDLSLCATLVTLNQPIRFLTSQSNSKKVFYFGNNEKLQEIVKQFWAREIRVEPMDYYGNLKQVKNRIYNE